MIRDIVLLVARLLMASMFIASAVGKIQGDPNEKKAIQALHIPYPGSMERLAGICEVIGAAMLVLGIYARTASGLLIAFMIAVTILFLHFWSFEEPEQDRHNQMTAFFSNLSTVAGLLQTV